MEILRVLLRDGMQVMLVQYMEGADCAEAKLVLDYMMSALKSFLEGCCWTSLVSGRMSFDGLFQMMCRLLSAAEKLTGWQ